jgi:hypothetical protein
MKGELLTETADLSAIESANDEEKDDDDLLEFAEGEDPVGRFGYGLLSYFNLIFSLLTLSGIVFLMYTPMLFYYRSWSGLIHDHTSIFGVQYTLGNLGAAKTKC